MSLAPHQARVVAEKAALDENLVKLKVFIDSEKFTALVPDMAERARLSRQRTVMEEYSDILFARIEAFHA